jgi:predicted RNA-binding protein with PUA-like domain
LFYHSNAKPSGIAGLARVVKTAYPDPTQFDSASDHFDPKAKRDKPIWFQVDVAFSEKFERFLSLDELRGVPGLSEMMLFRRSRLSVQPVSSDHYRLIQALSSSSKKIR